MHQYPFLKLLYPCGSFKGDSWNVVSKGGEISFKYLLSTRVLNFWDGSWWMHGRPSTVIDACPFEVCHMSHVMTLVLTCLPLELNYLFKRSFWLLRDKGGYHMSFYQSEIRCHASGQILSLTTVHPFLLHSLDVGFGCQWSGWRSCFDKTGCLQWLSGLVFTHSMYRPWFLQGLSGFSTVPLSL